MTAEGVLVHEVPWALGLDPRAVWDLRGVLGGFRPDVAHAHDSHALSVLCFALGSIGRGAGRRQSSSEPPAVLAHRRVDFHVRKRSAWFRADRLIAVSEAVKAILVTDGIDARDIVVIPDGIDPDEVRTRAALPLNIRDRLGLTATTPLAVNVAALVDHKDQATLIRAAHAARGLAADLHWAIAGDGELRRALERQIAELELGDRVHLLGYVPEADALIREGDVFVMSSKEEGLGSVVLDALALGKPIVATRAGGLPEIVPADGLVPVGDAMALGRKVVAALVPRSPFPVPAFPERFTATAMAAAVLACYRSLA